jgi:hypothetical protein
MGMVHPIDRAEALPYVILPFQGSHTSAFFYYMHQTEVKVFFQI